MNSTTLNLRPIYTTVCDQKHHIVLPIPYLLFHKSYCTRPSSSSSSFFCQLKHLYNLRPFLCPLSWTCPSWSSPPTRRRTPPTSAASAATADDALLMETFHLKSWTHSHFPNVFYVFFIKMQQAVVALPCMHLLCYVTYEVRYGKKPS